MKNKIITIVVSIILVSGALATAFVLSKNAGTKAVDLVFFGDSIVAGVHSENDLPAYIQRHTDISIQNGAFGGMTMAKVQKEKYSGDYNDFYTMAGLSEAVKEHDFSFQLMASERDNPAMWEYWNRAAVELSEIDFSSVKYILIEHGANDYLDGVQLDDEEDPYNVYTFGGALRTSIENLKKGAPNAKIVICTPIYMYYDGAGGDCNEYSFGGGFLYEYVELEKEIARDYGLYVIDNFAEVEINKDNYKTHLHQGVHPFESGLQMIGDNILKHLEVIR